MYIFLKQEMERGPDGAAASRCRLRRGNAL